MRETMLIAVLLLSAAIAGCGNVSHRDNVQPTAPEMAMDPCQAFVQADIAAESNGVAQNV